MSLCVYACAGLCTLIFLLTYTKLNHVYGKPLDNHGPLHSLKTEICQSWASSRFECWCMLIADFLKV